MDKDWKDKKCNTCAYGIRFRCTNVIVCRRFPPSSKSMCGMTQIYPAVVKGKEDVSNACAEYKEVENA